MKTLLRQTLLALLLIITSCSQISDLIDSVTNADCDDFLQTEATASLAEECQNLENYLDAESNSLREVSQIIPTNSITQTGTTFFQLTDTEGEPLANIAEENVTVAYAENSDAAFTEVAGATVTTLSEVETTQAAILANVDYSGSISDGDLEDVTSGLNMFLNTLTVGYNGGVIKFSESVDLVQEFTENTNLIIDAVNDTSYTRSYTSLYDALYDGVSLLAEQSQPLKLMILFTDGIDNDSSHTLDEAILHAQENKIPVCVIGVTFADASTLQRIADDTGCFYIYKNFFTSLDESFAAFAEQINSFQMVTLPDGFTADSGTLKITVDAGEASAREFTSDF